MRRNTTWLPGATTGDPLRPTATQRPLVVAVLDDSREGFPTTHPYVRNFWLPLVGPGAVADLLRLAPPHNAAVPSSAPRTWPRSYARGLARPIGPTTIAVHDHVPGLEPAQVRRLHPSLRRAHQILTAATERAVA